MKKILLLLLIVSASSLYSQWVKGFFTDDFGDPTDKSFLKQTIIGTFSNTATTNSVCKFNVFKTDDEYQIRIYPYNSNHMEDWIEGVYGSPTIYIKRPSGKKDTLSGDFYNGIITINSEIQTDDFSYEKEMIRRTLDILEIRKTRELRTKDIMSLKRRYGPISEKKLKQSIAEHEADLVKAKHLFQLRTKLWGKPQFNRLNKILESEDGEFIVIAKYNENTYKFKM